MTEAASSTGSAFDILVHVEDQRYAPYIDGLTEAQIQELDEVIVDAVSDMSVLATEYPAAELDFVPAEEDAPMTVAQFEAGCEEADLIFAAWRSEHPVINGGN